ncbi:S66 family peptidase [Fructobacillus tropaeoli]|uniref:S66 family peptidase n=1 Tax=Fructobacillus tropaeoli TaxID=709323 RepID=UPI0015E16925|nr:S66 peptidase family protein [Fructobacillus tropaeoli]
MIKMIPKKLKAGDEIRVISPSFSMERVGGFNENLVAKQRLEHLNFKVTFGKHINKNDRFFSSDIRDRVADLHDAFLDSNVKAVLTTVGGWNANELLPFIDWKIIRNNPKAFIGYSDTTSLHNAIRAKTNMVTYYGPSYSSFKMDELQTFQTKQWLKSVQRKSYFLEPSEVYTSDPWFDKSQPRHPMPNKWKIYHHGSSIGTITGGNIQTYYLQAGTSYFPQVKNPILFIEEAESDGNDFGLGFSRELAQILQLHPDIQGLVIGRFPVENKVSEEQLIAILNKYPILQTVPVVYDVDFGHTQPIFTFPLGGQIQIKAENLEELQLEILEG